MSSCTAFCAGVPLPSGVVHQAASRRPSKCVSMRTSQPSRRSVFRLAALAAAAAAAEATGLTGAIAAGDAPKKSKKPQFVKEVRRAQALYCTRVSNMSTPPSFFGLAGTTVRFHV